MPQLPLIALTLIVLNGSSAYAEWVPVSSSESLGGYTAYLDPDTIRRKGHLVKEWELYDFKTIQTLAGKSHLSLKMQHEYDCTKERSRGLAHTFFSGNMGTGNVVSTGSSKSNWNPLEAESIAQDLWKVACGKK